MFFPQQFWGVFLNLFPNSFSLPTVTLHSRFFFFFFFFCLDSIPDWKYFKEQLATWYFTKNNTSQVVGKRVSFGGTPIVQSLESGMVAESWFLEQDKPQTW